MLLFAFVENASDLDYCWLLVTNKMWPVLFLKFPVVNKSHETKTSDS